MLNNQLKEMESFVKISEHVNIVLNNMKNIDEIDTNDIYDLMYEKEKLNRLLVTGIENEDIKQDSIAIIKRIDTVLDTVDFDKISENKLKDTKKSNKAKYENKNKFLGLKDYSKFSKKYDFLLDFGRYINSQIALILTYSLLFLVMYYMPEMTRTIESMVSRFLGFEDTTVETVETVEALTSTVVNPSEYINELAITLKNFIGIIAICMVIVVITRSIIFTIELASNGKLGNIKVFGIKLKDTPILKTLCKEAEQVIEDNKTKVYNKINSQNRIETSEALLHNMLIWFKDSKNLKKSTVFSDEKSYKEQEYTMKELDKKLKDKRLTVREKLETCVKIELLYEQTESLLEIDNITLRLNEEELA